MMKGIVGKVSHNWIMGWVFDPENIEPIKIDVTYNKGLIARGVANFYREDLLQETKHINGRCGFKIHIPFLNCKLSKLVVMANGEELTFSNHLIKKE